MSVGKTASTHTLSSSGHTRLELERACKWERNQERVFHAFCFVCCCTFHSCSNGRLNILFGFNVWKRVVCVSRETIRVDGRFWEGLVVSLVSNIFGTHWRWCFRRVYDERTVGNQVFNSLASVTLLGLRLLTTLCSDMVGEFAAVVASVHQRVKKCV